MGHVATTRAMLVAVERATAVGTGTVLVKNSRPCGDLGGIARLAAHAGMIGITTTSFAIEQSAGASASDALACAIPAAAGASPWVARASGEALGDVGSLLCGLLTTGLVGINTQSRKRKALNAANTVEYSLIAIDPEKFAPAGALSSIWQDRLSASAHFTAAIVPDEAAASTILLRSDHARTLTELAAKIKFPVTW